VNISTSKNGNNQTSTNYGEKARSNEAKLNNNKNVIFKIPLIFLYEERIIIKYD
jgi:hypothetical protein